MKTTGPRSAHIYRATPRNLARLAAALRRGELVAVPTETVYGLAANALDEAACRHIFTAKGRPAQDPLIVHIGHLRELDAIADSNPAALILARKFWPGPLTMVLPKKSAVPGIVSAGLATVAVRLPNHPVFLRLQRLTGLPLAVPSANPFGYVSPTTARHVHDGLGARIKYILDGGPTPIGLESTIVDLRNPRRVRILRPGAVTREQIAQALGCDVSAPRQRKPAPHAAQLAPGMLTRHYSPRTPVTLHRHLPDSPHDTFAKTDAWVFFTRPLQISGKNIFALTSDGSPAAAAHRLFSTLRRLDRKGYRTIHIEEAPKGGLGDAINDRLRRAAARE